MKDYVIYEHLDAKGERFYIGSGQINYRKDGTINYGQSRPYCNIGRNSDWYDRVMTDGKQIWTTVILKDGLTKDDSLELEDLIIRVIGLDNLTNKCHPIK